MPGTSAELTEKTEAAVLERDAAKRAAMYKEMQKTVLEDSPFVIVSPADRGRGVAQAT